MENANDFCEVFMSDKLYSERLCNKGGVDVHANTDYGPAGTEVSRFRPLCKLDVGFRGVNVA